MIHKISTFLFLLITIKVFAQSNTAVTSGAVGKCGVWDYPYTLYNNASTTHNINNGVTVTVDQNRSSGAVVLNGSGAMDLSGSNGISFSGSGSEITCKWDIYRSETGYIVNNDNKPADVDRNLGTFLTVPYAGNYIWKRGSGWSALISGSYYNGSITMSRNTNVGGIVFYQNTTGPCGLVPGYPVVNPNWGDTINANNLNVGDVLHYNVGTASDINPSTGLPGTCGNTRLDYTIGNAVLLYNN